MDILFSGLPTFIILTLALLLVAVALLMLLAAMYCCCCLKRLHRSLAPALEFDHDLAYLYPHQ